MFTRVHNGTLDQFYVVGLRIEDFNPKLATKTTFTRDLGETFCVPRRIDRSQ